MEFSEPVRDEPEFALGIDFRKDVAEAGGITAYIRSRIEEHSSMNEQGQRSPYYANVKQLERIAKAAAAPNGTPLEEKGLPQAGAFYMGGMIALELGAKGIEGNDEIWSSRLYENLNNMYRTMQKNASEEVFIPTEGKIPDAVTVSAEAARALLISSYIVGQLDIETSIPLPDILMSICSEYTSSLSLSESEQPYLEYGYTLAMRVFTQLCVELTDAETKAEEADLETRIQSVGTEDAATLAANEAALGEMLGDIAEWDVLRMNDEPSE